MSLTPAQTAEFLAFAEELADAARTAILPFFRAGVAAENKLARGFDPVTQADKNAEAAMRKLIEARYPEHGVLGEEYGATPSASGFTWVLDPIDGTRAFIAGLPLWGTLIGLTYESRPVIGIIDQAYLDERFRGWPGGADLIAQGATRTLSVRACETLRDAVIATTDPFLFSGAEAGGFEHVRATAKLSRYGCDCYAYAMVALGGVDLVIESGLNVWDVAALIPVIEGAGGTFTNWRGEPAWNGGQVIAAGDARAHAEALLPLKRAAQ